MTTTYTSSALPIVQVVGGAFVPEFITACVEDLPHNQPSSALDKARRIEMGYAALAQFMLDCNCQGMLPFKNDEYPTAESRPETKMLRMIASGDLVVIPNDKVKR